MSDPALGTPAPTREPAPAVLFVDDEPKSVKYFVRLFARDFPLLTASSVAEAEAVLALEGERVGVLMTDQRMPVESGVTLLDRVKERYPLIVRLLTTAYADLDSAVAAVNRGEIHRYLVKPWDIDQLRDELHGAMQLHLRQRREQELLAVRRQTVLSLASYMAHELRTPLAAIRCAAHNLQDYWPDLVQAYRREVARGERTAAGGPPLGESVLTDLESMPGEIQSVVDRANMLINLLLMNTRGDATNGGRHPPVSVLNGVQAALAGYPFRPGERERVVLEGADFQAGIPEVALSFTLYNLLSNALEAIGAAGRGDIRIRLEPGGSCNRLWLRDTGPGITPELLPRVFDEFVTGKPAGRGTGLGLAFCRRVMRGIGGDIACRSRLGEYTELELRFPGPQAESARLHPPGDAMDRTEGVEGDARQ
jgi:signal transduction histidine kinase